MGKEFGSPEVKTTTMDNSEKASRKDGESTHGKMAVLFEDTSKKAEWPLTNPTTPLL